MQSVGGLFWEAMAINSVSVCVIRYAELDARREERVAR